MRSPDSPLKLNRALTYGLAYGMRIGFLSIAFSLPLSLWTLGVRYFDLRLNTKLGRHALVNDSYFTIWDGAVLPKPLPVLTEVVLAQLVAGLVVVGILTAVALRLTFRSEFASVAFFMLAATLGALVTLPSSSILLVVIPSSACGLLVGILAKRILPASGLRHQRSHIDRAKPVV